MLMDEPKKPARGDTTNHLARLKAIEMRTQGRQINEIAQELGYARGTISEWLNSRELKAKIQAANERLANMLDKAVDVQNLLLANAAQDPTNAEKASRGILKTFGVLKETVDITHQFPKPTVIKRFDGTEVVLGSVTEKVVEEIKKDDDGTTDD